MSQIIWVAYNRAKKTAGRADKPGALTSTVAPPGRPTWNAHSSYREPYGSREAGAPEIQAFVRAVLEGRPATYRGEAAIYPRLIGERRHFLHPGGMPRCANVGQGCGRGKICTQTLAGPRCLPTWNVEGHASIKTIGGARFS